MRPVYFPVPKLSLLPLLALTLAACPGNGAGPALLTPEEVAGTYEICSLVFTPENSLFPAVDVRAKGIDMRPQAPLRAALRLRDNATTFDFRYTTPPPTDDIVQLGGTYQLGTNTVALVFTSTAAARATVLLPARLDLEFQATPRKELHTAQTPIPYSVPRADYARLAGVSEQGLAPEIPGTLSARFAMESCE